MKKPLIKDWNLYYELVKFFNTYFGFKQDPELIPNTIKLRDALEQEELQEYALAHKSGDLVAIADAIGDTVYVVLGSLWTYKGTILEGKYLDKLEFLKQLIALYFTPEQFYKIFMEIHRSNMSKACKSLDSVYATMAQPKYKNVKYKYTQKGDEYFIILDEDVPELGLKKGKLIKSIDYSEANLEFVRQWEIAA